MSFFLGDFEGAKSLQNNAKKFSGNSFHNNFVSGVYHTQWILIEKGKVSTSSEKEGRMGHQETLLDIATHFPTLADVPVSEKN